MKPIDTPWTTLVDVATLATALGGGVRVVDAANKVAFVQFGGGR